jgi:lambda repressor-like predicted transcriptional regulator
MPWTDPTAADILRELRAREGWSPEALANAIAERARKENWRKGTVDAYTIRRIEGIPGRADRPPLVPYLRVQVVIATFFGLDRREIWQPGKQTKLERTRVSA